MVKPCYACPICLPYENLVTQCPLIGSMILFLLIFCVITHLPPEFAFLQSNLQRGFVASSLTLPSLCDVLDKRKSLQNIRECCRLRSYLKRSSEGQACRDDLQIIAPVETVVQVL